jgi:PST family polysaccharide transporter
VVPALAGLGLMPEQASARRILSATSILGGASVVTLMLSLIRTKVFALLLGPSGIGLLGLVNNLMTSGSLLTGMGVGTSSVRLLSEAWARGDQQSIGRSRTVLLSVTVVLALLAIGIFWLLQRPIGLHLLGDVSRVPLVVWVGVGVGLSLLAGVQIAILNSLRLVAEFARVQVASALLATLVGVGAIWTWGADALLVFVLAVPLSSLLVASWFVSRLDIPLVPVGAREVAAEGARLARLGILFMVAQLVISGGLLAVRARIEWQLDTEALGIFEAAWLLSSVYLGAVLTAMTTDYYPRLSGLTHDDAATAALVNDQTRVALWLCAPACVALIGLAPVAVHVLFSSKFAGTAEILRWQVIGDIMKVMAWPLGFVLLARNDGRHYLVLETTAILALVSTVWLLLPKLGLVATGLGVLVMYCVYLPLGRAFVRRHVDFDWDRGVKGDAAVSLAAAVATALAATYHPVAGGALGLVLGGALAWRSWGRLQKLVGSEGWRATLRPSSHNSEVPQ